MNENGLQRLTVSPGDAGVRIDKYLAEQLPDITRSYLQKLLKDGSVQMNGKPVKASTKTAVGAVIALTIPEPEEPEILPENIPLDILYEDSDVILINKPKDIRLLTMIGKDAVA